MLLVYCIQKLSIKEDSRWTEWCMLNLGPAYAVLLINHLPWCLSSVYSDANLYRVRPHLLCLSNYHVGSAPEKPVFPVTNLRPTGYDPNLQMEGLRLLTLSRRHYDTQHNDIQHNNTEQKRKENTTHSIIPLSTAADHCYDECCYAECRYAECLYAECRGTRGNSVGARPRGLASYVRQCVT